MRIKSVFFIFFILFLFIDARSDLEDYTYVPLRRKLKYAEEFYSLFRENFKRGTDNLNANVFWLLHALEYPFAPPQLALAKIETPDQWEKYKTLFRFQVYYLITDTYLRLGERYEKPNILFFNYTFKKEILEGFEIAKVYYNRAKFYWEKAKKLAYDAWELRDIDLYSIDGETDKWMDRVYKLVYSRDQEMNYDKEIKERIEEVDYKIKMLNRGEYKK
ncbi:MAG TPA: hypothetical protein PKW55_08735 [Spirochaetota bacterium]|nr:hypothetical protein [Spirochaetota bacterium]HOM39162.1 hypothetical protein [Spirochaetota bacterium]HPQ48339.1 hypothetical protein [Spirochaetota bacterium]